MGPAAAETIDWPGLFRRAAAGAQRALERSPDLTATAGPGAGGDVSLAIDRAVEDVVFAELEALGTGLTAISEERGEVHLCGGGPVHVVIDPIDGSRNAARGSRPFSLSIAVADGPRMQNVRHAYVRDLGGGEEFTAERGRGARLNDSPSRRYRSRAALEIVGIESADPRLVAAQAAALVDSGARRLRGLGSVALSLCHVAAGRFDGAVTPGTDPVGGLRRRPADGAGGGRRGGVPRGGGRSGRRSARPRHALPHRGGVPAPAARAADARRRRRLSGYQAPVRADHGRDRSSSRIERSRNTDHRSR